MSIAAVQLSVLRMLANGPRYARSLQPSGALRLVPRLQELGLVERVKPARGRANNMVALTAAGAAAIGLAQ